ncbi:MAG TPA: hypothetical protein VH575_28365 [Gemmataceae bacterium]|jgi:hypothetical protein
MADDFAQQVRQWLNEHGAQIKACWACEQAAGWLIGDEPILPQAWMGTKMGTVPLVVLACKNCGFVRLYSAKMLGWKPPPSASDELSSNGFFH